MISRLCLYHNIKQKNLEKIEKILEIIHQTNFLPYLTFYIIRNVEYELQTISEQNDSILDLCATVKNSFSTYTYVLKVKGSAAHSLPSTSARLTKNGVQAALKTPA